MALIQVGHTNSEGTPQIGDMTWKQAFGEWPDTLGKVLPGDIVELRPGTHTKQKFFVHIKDDPKNPVKIKVIDNAQDPVIFDGEYEFPQGKAARIGKDGAMTHSGLFDVRSAGVHLFGVRENDPWRRNMLKITRSRGRGIVVTGDDLALENFVADGVEVGHCRSLAIMPRFVKGGSVMRCNFHHCGDYYQGHRDINLFNWPGILVIHACENFEVGDNDVHHTWTDGIMATMSSKNTHIFDNRIFEIGGNAALYMHGAEDWLLERNLLYLTGDMAWSHRKDVFDGCAAIVCNNEEEKQFEGMAVRNGRAINNVIVGMTGLGIWGNEGANRPIENVSLEHNTVIGQGLAKPIRVARKTGLRSVSFKSNLIYHPDDAYGEIVSGEGIDLAGNGWGGKAPPAGWNTKGDQVGVKLKNPDAPLVAGEVDIENYRTLAPSGLGASTGVDSDYEKKARKYWTVGAFEFQDTIVVPPTTQHIEIRLNMDVNTESEQDMRTALAGAVVTVQDSAPAKATA